MFLSESSQIVHAVIMPVNGYTHIVNTHWYPAYWANLPIGFIIWWNDSVIFINFAWSSANLSCVFQGRLSVGSRNIVNSSVSPITEWSISLLLSGLESVIDFLAENLNKYYLTAKFVIWNLTLDQKQWCFNICIKLYFSV